jgi:hypothetical protein
LRNSPTFGIGADRDSRLKEHTMVQTMAELMPQILLQLQQGPMTRTPLMTALGCRLQPKNFTRALAALVRDQRVLRTGRSAYSSGPRGFEPFSEEDAVRLGSGVFGPVEAAA